MKQNLLIIQSGAAGDIFVVAPIAKYYQSKGYTVYWPVREPYFNFVDKYLPYVTAIKMTEEIYPKLHSDWLRSDTINIQRLVTNYDIVIDTSDRDSKTNQQPYENFEQYKYRIANVPFSFKHHLSWKEDKDRETDLIEIIQNTHGINIIKDDYITCHLSSSHGDKAAFPLPVDGTGLTIKEGFPVVEVTQIDGFEIVDWYTIIANSRAFYGVESSVHQFVDGCVHRLRYYNKEIQLFLLSRSSLKAGESYTISQYWSKAFMK